MLIDTSRYTPVRGRAGRDAPIVRGDRTKYRIAETVAGRSESQGNGGNPACTVAIVQDSIPGLMATAISEGMLFCRKAAHVQR